MTHEDITVRGLSADENATLNRLLAQLDAKAARNLLRAQVYDGKRALQHFTNVVPRQYMHMGLTLGWVAKGIDALARRCTLETMTWDDGSLDDLGGGVLFGSNNLRSELNSTGVSSLLHATAFLINVAGEPGEPSSLILSRSAQQATGTWNPRKRALDDFVSVNEWRDDKPSALTLYLDGLTISAEKPKDGSWAVVDRSAHPWGVPVEVLPHRPRLGRPFGSSRATRAAMSAQFAGLRDLVRLEGHMDAFSYPELLLLGARAEDFRDANGNTITSWQAMMGRIKGLPDDEDAQNPRASVQNIAASSPDPHLAVYNMHAKTLCREMGLPDSALAMSDFANPTSAEAYDASQYELIADARGVIDDWSGPVERAFRRGLMIQNGLSEEPAEWRTIRSNWRNPQFLTRAAEADAGVKQLAAVPWLAETEVGLELLGLSRSQMDRALAERRRQAGSAALASILERAAGTVNDSDDAADPAVAS